MLKAAASVEDGGTMLLTASANSPDGSLPSENVHCRLDPAARERGANMKPATATPRFFYATGSRPLDGYTIKRGVGTGGFGEVYFAVSDAGKEVALKRIQRNLDVEIRGVSQCLNLKHPNLVAIYDIRYDDEGQAWVVMEYVRGESLKDVIEQHPDGLPLAELLHWFQGIAAGVEYLHDHGIVHRDLKPGNIFLDEGVVKIGDYGLSKYISCSRRSGQTESVGTFHYMAPEIGRGVYGKEIDLYALGIILYELLTGRVPFDGESSHEIIMKHLTALPDVSGLPAAFRPTIERALFKDPTKRFPDVKLLRTAVEHAAGGAPADRTPLHEPVLGRPAAKSPSPSPRDMEPAAEGMYFGPVQHIRSAVAVEEPAASSSVAEEPIARAVLAAWQNVVQWWNGPGLNRPARIVLGILFAVLLITNAGWVLPVGIVLGSTYLVYFGVRAIILSFQTPSPSVRPATSLPANSRGEVAVQTVPQPLASPAAPPAAAGPRPIPVRKRKRWHEIAQEQLRAKPVGERLIELTGSMLMSATVVAVVSLLAMIITGFPMDGSTQMVMNFTWIALVSLVGTWTLLVFSKLWEGTDEDQVRRRFLCLLAGLGVGAFAFSLANFLGLELVAKKLVDLPRAWDPPLSAFAAGGIPRWPAFLAYFGGLFVVLRWWSLADPLRASRFSIWATAVTLILACVWQIFWPFPQPWSFVVPATMAIALQLSSTWLTTSYRNQLRNGAGGRGSLHAS